MKKNLFRAFVCLMAVGIMMACGDGNNPGGRSNAKKWLTNPSEIDEALVDTTATPHCWEYRVWCDGTVIGTEYVWAPEAAIIFMIKSSMNAEKTVLGAYHKRYYYEQTPEGTEGACESRTWEGAECWLETVRYKDKTTGLEYSEQEYIWLPEANTKEREDYYVQQAAATGVLSCTHERVTDKTDRDACIEMNPEDPNPPVVNPTTDKKCYKVTADYGVGGKTEFYYWYSEAEIQQFITANSLGMAVTFSYEEADANDQASCQALNAQ